MQPVYVVGGAQKENAVQKEEWHSHAKGIVAWIDPDRDEYELRLEYVSPPDLIPDEDPNILFKAATFCGTRCYLCTSTEILEYSYPDLRFLRRISHPCFNDVHHVHVAPDGHLYVANTGLDMVVELDGDGTILREWNVVDDSDPWQRFSRDIDYRKVASTKPHRSHPNFVFTASEHVWVTRFHQKDAVCLTEPGWRIELGVERPHDGVVWGDLVYFTTVDGHIIVADLRTRAVRDVYDLTEMQKGLRKVGWCRGLAVLDEKRILVGFSRLRPTRWKANLQWLKHGLRELYTLCHQPARVALFDLDQRRELWEFPLNRVGMSTVFSIHLDAACADELRSAA
ncbi:MAG TPA: hypothetical protein EYP14_09680, partial [Planctomycetaceae bacterium]|nr:hypothetical protein [Planctomycetaceae bacterium]